jgi:hypothetical protein
MEVIKELKGKDILSGGLAPITTASFFKSFLVVPKKINK